MIAFSIDNSFTEVKGLAVTHISIRTLALPRNIKVSMSDGVPDEPKAERCPACGARMRGEDAWCGQCHTARLRASAASQIPALCASERAPEAALEAEAEAEVAAVAVAAAEAGPAPSAPEVPDALVASWLTQLAAQHPPVLRGRWAVLGKRNAQILLAGGGGLLIVGLALLAMVLVGRLV